MAADLGLQGIEAEDVEQPARVWRTVEALAHGALDHHHQEVEEEAELEEVRYFMLDSALRVFAERQSVSGPRLPTLYDLTGSRGLTSVAASLLYAWGRCVSLEATEEDERAAAALFKASDSRRRRRLRASGKPPRFEAPSMEILSSRRLWNADWQDADFAVCDCSRISDALDQGAFIADVVRRGVAKALAGTYVLLITRDARADAADDRCGLLDPAAGPASCALVHSQLAIARDLDCMLRADLLQVKGHTCDHRISVANTLETATTAFVSSATAVSSRARTTTTSTRFS